MLIRKMRNARHWLKCLYRAKGNARLANKIYDYERITGWYW